MAARHSSLQDKTELARRSASHPVSFNEAFDMLDLAMASQSIELAELKRSVGAFAADSWNQIKANPWPYIGGVASAGLAVGYWLGRRQ